MRPLTYHPATAAVERINGLVLDELVVLVRARQLHILPRGDDLAGIEQIPAELFFLQLLTHRAW